ncbi:hypothetical protein [Halobellus sp. GM3]|uniref:hypothetical protein n=1 Tax=Halobellus sp. GM3 TaxID=3458410 RepID=UPI00403DD110
MGIRRGTVLGLTGVAGALIERQFGILGTALLNLTGLGPLPAVLSWILGCFAGVVAGDLATGITGQDVSLGRLAGIKKGLIASTVAALGFYLSSNGLVVGLLGGPLHSVPVFTPSSLLLIGSIWVGAVLGDFFDA